MPSSTRYPRHGENGGFDRVVYFTDAVFAIAMTLLVVEIGVPETIEGAAEDPAAMLDALGDKGPLIFAFFLGCYVIGSYWAAHHRFMTWLSAVDRGFVALTVVYLSFVALLPFPTGVLGEFGENPVSTMEAVLFSHARRRRLFREELPEEVYRWALRTSLLPVLLFALSLPVAFVRPWLAILMWLMAFPLQLVLGRYRPAGAQRYLA
jgi:TMEM175 potassium channel family protein